MGDTLDFPAFPGQPELDGDAYEVWGERHEALEDLADELQDRLDELE